jgi:hypothetical protein
VQRAIVRRRRGFNPHQVCRGHYLTGRCRSTLKARLRGEKSLAFERDE